jgi:4'-phosphopantetheinyl transferase
MTNAAEPFANLWLLDGSRVPEDDLTFYAANLDGCDALRLATFARTHRRRQFLLGRMLLRVAIADLTGLPVDEICVIQETGKPPRLKTHSEHQFAPNFSMSHSRNWVACATSLSATLGLDIEVIDSRRDIISLGEVAFDPSEQAWFLSQPAAERVSAFYKLWSAKEAMYKLRCNLGRRPEDLPTTGDESVATFLNEGLHRYDLTVPGLSLVLCTDLRLAEIRNVKLNGLSPACGIRSVDFLYKSECSPGVRESSSPI